MKKVIKYTQEQLKSAQDLLTNKNAANQSAKLFHSLHEPENLYVKYTGFEIMNDGGILSESIFKCINVDGKISDCLEVFSLREKMQFLADAIEIDIDERGKMVML
jgi:hypothetical protein